MHSSQRNKEYTSQEVRSSRRGNQPRASTSYSQSMQSTQIYRSSQSLEIENDSQEEQQLVSDLVEYILIEDSSKKPIVKRKMIKNVLGSRGKEFNKLIPKVKASLHNVFGYKLVELDSSKYIVVNEVENSTLHAKYSNAERPQLVLLFIVLAHIFMQDDSCMEGVLWAFLKHLGIISDDNYQHPYFGNVKELINEDFLAQKYLNRVVYEAGEPPKYEYKWGPRADHELSRRAVMEFVSQVYNGRPLNSWPLQYKALLERERNSSNQE